jgi:hypothetical protein
MMVATIRLGSKCDGDDVKVRIRLIEGSILVGGADHGR